MFTAAERRRVCKFAGHADASKTRTHSGPLSAREYHGEYVGWPACSELCPAAGDPHCWQQAQRIPSQPQRWQLVWRSTIARPRVRGEVRSNLQESG